ncbi:SpvB/TcaC N-terminal domain-containing protein [Streptomyces narbonensis]|uniref:SpvB/TcaC N-terminal domain-containing protein n=1 Tax=Streptomyces narbonensis TaxID=67333 RepID=UPI0033C32D9B
MIKPTALTGGTAGHDGPSAPDGATSGRFSLPQGGGALRSTSEKFAANPVTGTGTFALPLPLSPGRSGFGPELSLTYDSANGNGPFGFGWSLALPAVTRKTERGLPRYLDSGTPTDHPDVFVMSGAEDLVPVLTLQGRRWAHIPLPRTVRGTDYLVHAYRPRTEGLFARVERWVRDADGDTHWRCVTADNITTVYGRDPASRISAPHDPRHPAAGRVFSWLISESHDDRGNWIQYTYKPEDGTGVDPARPHESGRTEAGRSAQRYLKTIRYGNRSPRPDDGDDGLADWMFEVVLDYGEHGPDRPRPADTGPWTARSDPFSSRRPGFELRTHRLCRRVLMFHHFPDEAGIGRDCLVRSMDFRYEDRDRPEADGRPGRRLPSFLAAATECGYRRRAAGYLRRSMPPVEFEYSRARVEGRVREPDAEALANLPEGLTGRYRLVDLDGEGLAGILTDQGGGSFYRRNLGDGRFGPLRQLTRVPSGSDPDGGAAPLIDLAGDGSLDLVRFAGPAPGFHERVTTSPAAGPSPRPGAETGATGGTWLSPTASGEGDWDRFTGFRSLPVIDWSGPGPVFADLSGDGHPDVLVPGEDHLIWYPSLGEDGFGPGRRVPLPAPDGDDGPRLLDADPRHAVFFADMTGDGLADLVRVTDGEVRYWPNLGHGRFGTPVTMDDAPRFAQAGHFDHQRLRLADIDGSGTCDLVYFGGDSVALYFNESGNGWSPPHPLPGFPRTDSAVAVDALDLLGNGTACLVWSSPLPGDARRPLAYVDLMGGTKPHLLTGIRTNLGAETHVRYVPSTHCSRDSEREGRPWATRIPFPVHVVERVETHDRVTGHRYVSRYRYHHGHYDGVEREFCGFGMVERFDTEEHGPAGETESDPTAAVAATPRPDPAPRPRPDPATLAPPVLTRTWFHTGEWREGDRLSARYAHEYFREDPAGDAGPLLEDTRLPDTVRLPDPDASDDADGPPPATALRLPWSLTPTEIRDACRALRGMPLRTETYALDGPARDLRDLDDRSAPAGRPYQVSEHSYTVELLQPAGPHPHAVVLTAPRETLTCQYERALFGPPGEEHPDPRVTHTAVLDTDYHGRAVREVTIGYGRRVDDPDPLLTDEDRARQRQTVVTYGENRWTRPLDPATHPDAHRLPQPCESRTYELVGVVPEASPLDAHGRPRTPLFRFDELRAKLDAAADGGHDLPFEDVEHAGTRDDGPHRRLLARLRARYRADDLSRLLPHGRHEPLALPGETLVLALTPGLLDRALKRGQDPLLPAGEAGRSLLAEAGYVQDEAGEPGEPSEPGERGGGWWIPSGRVYYHPLSSATHAEELAFARENFFLPHRFTDAFERPAEAGRPGEDGRPAPGPERAIVVGYDRVHRLFAVESRDALGSFERAAYDYVVLQPHTVTDANGNRTAVAFDALGQVTATAVLGKESAADAVEGDTLDGFRTAADTGAPPDVPAADTLTDPDTATLQAFTADPVGQAPALLAGATTRTLYDLHRFARCGQAPYVATLVRETHVADTEPGAETGIQVAFSYSDGLGRHLQTKTRAAPGEAALRAPATVTPSGDVRPGPLTLAEAEADPTGGDDAGGAGRPRLGRADPCWMGTGRTVYDNKGRPVRQYEPSFSSTHLCEEERETTDTGVSGVTFYDPLGRPVAALHPDHTYVKTVFDPWRQHSWDANDTVALDPRTDPDVAALTRAHFATEPPTWRTWHTLRAEGAFPGPLGLPEAERDAAAKALAHAGTPTLSVVDSLGRVFLTAADNGGGERHTSRAVIDVQGNQRSARDARGRTVMTAEYDLLGRPLYTGCADAGERWTLPDVTGRPVRTWNGRGHTHRVTYDALRRPVEVFVRDPGDEGTERLVERTVYGEERGSAQNHRGRVAEVYDEAGRLTHDAFDFKGNLLRSTRRFLSSHRAPVDWPQELGSAADALLADESFTATTAYDALNRTVRSTSAHSDRDGATVDVTQPRHDAAGRLTGIDVWLQRPGEPAGPLPPETADLHVVTDITYNARGDRTSVRHGNGTVTTFTHHPRTYRLIRLETTRGNEAVQRLEYTYDPVGNLTSVRDTANDRVFHDQECVDPSSGYLYDPTYRLVAASGREHRGGDAQVDHDRTPRSVTALPTDCQALRGYVETYRYDETGNLLGVRHHRGADVTRPGEVVWHRRYQYATVGNRLLATSLPADPPRLPDHTDSPGYTARYSYDEHGNTTAMPHLPDLAWDHQDRLREAGLGGGGRVFFAYDGAGRRLRKVREKGAGVIEERISFGGSEIFRRVEGGRVTLERETLHIEDGDRRVALIETRTRQRGDRDRAPRRLVRHQYGDHIGSTALELDEDARVITYEEYHPYGSTAYQAARSRTETPKRYGYAARERDEETGLSVHGLRYYATWLGRWASCDPAGLIDGANLYRYAGGNPVGRVDITGTEWQTTPILSPNGAPTSQVWVGEAEPETPKDGIPQASLTGPSKVTSRAARDAAAAPSAAPPPVKRKPAHATPKPAPPAMSDAESMQNLKALAERFQPTLTYDPMVTRFMGVVQLIGGALEVAGGLAAEADSAGVSTLVVLNGLDTSQSAARMIATGKPANSMKYELSRSAASRLGADDRLANAFGVLGDTFGNAAGAGASMHMAGKPAGAPPVRGSMTGPGMAASARRRLSPGTRARLRRAINTEARKYFTDAELGGPPEGGPWPPPREAFYEQGTDFGGNTKTSGVWVEGNILDRWPDSPAYPAFNQAPLRTRVRAILAHEWIERNVGSHELAVQIGRNPADPRYWQYLQRFPQDARDLLMTMP